MLESSLPGLTLKARGKVRDIYEIGNDLLIVTTDRISAFDYILPVAIPRKGEVLNRISLFWFDHFRDLIPNHLITADIDQYPPQLAGYRSELSGRSVLVKRADIRDGKNIRQKEAFVAFRSRADYVRAIDFRNRSSRRRPRRRQVTTRMFPLSTSLRKSGRISPYV
jgi:hypothetical protein